MNTKRLSVLLLLFLLTTMRIGLLAAADSPAPAGVRETGEPRLEFADGFVVVHGMTATPQRIPLGGDAATDDNRDYFAFIEDMNFDGFPDVRVLSSQGLQNIYYDCWLWRPESQTFEKDGELSALSGLDFDPVSRHINTFTHISAVESGEGTLAYENGKLVWLDKTERTFDSARDRIVVRRHIRGEDGKLALASENSYTPEEWEAKQEAENHPELNFRIAGLPADLELLDGIALPDGSWWARQQADDDSITIESRRFAAAENGEAAVRRLVLLEWPAARDLKIEEFPALSEKTTYPCLKARFLTGENQGARLYVGALVQTDDWLFWFVLDASKETKLGEPDDDKAFPDNLAAGMEKMLLTLEATGDDNAVPAPRVPIYMLEESPRLSEKDIGVLDALIRIKKVVNPEENPWRQEERFAYRYDGLRDFADGPRLMFAFGGDSPEKFTAEHHFAVDGGGKVYEMEIITGSDYVECEEKVPGWWGEYKNGGTTLHIGNFRQGPMYYYFIFTFAADGKDIREGTAVVQGRKAVCEELIFTLAPDDDSVDVTLTADSPADAGTDDSRRLTGLYRRE